MKLIWAHTLDSRTPKDTHDPGHERYRYERSGRQPTLHRSRVLYAGGRASPSSAFALVRGGRAKHRQDHSHHLALCTPLSGATEIGKEFL